MLTRYWCIVYLSTTTLQEEQIKLQIEIQGGWPTFQICECEGQDIDFNDALGSMRMESRKIKAKMKQRRLYDRTVKAWVIREDRCVFMLEALEK